MDQRQEGATIGERFYPFVRVTPKSWWPLNIKRAQIEAINGALVKLNIKAAKGETLTPKERALQMRLSRNLFAINWRLLRSFAFQKTFAWKWFRIVPWQLRVKNIDRTIAGGIQVDFFEYLTSEETAFSKLLKSGSNTPTEKQNANSAA